ncbi:hypothetical protein HYALB_00001745 [Hymenoscyphus albidus]|uniref:Uncharacterized protein n=1 Tax=Hymenoscyphus albidus TaxID=595503 RepID=A0A9N9LQA0_9HELO|nr:hypothetical protein HYALB_00001745 [Hymenoscyphus albidus]
MSWRGGGGGGVESGEMSLAGTDGTGGKGSTSRITTVRTVSVALQWISDKGKGEDSEELQYETAPGRQGGGRKKPSPATTTVLPLLPSYPRQMFPRTLAQFLIKKARNIL